MKIINAVCKCKELSEEDKVVAIQETPFSSSYTWIWAVLLIGLFILVDSREVLVVAIGLILWDYVVSPKFKCQYCDKKIDKESYR